MGKRKWWILAAIIWMAAIFIITQLPYFTAKNTAKVIEKVVVTEQNAVNNTIVNSAENINELNLIVRKVTHVIVFGILSVLLFKSLETFRFGYAFHGFLPFYMHYQMNGTNPLCLGELLPIGMY